jgi:hypothetical protein
MRCPRRLGDDSRERQGQGSPGHFPDHTPVSATCPHDRSLLRGTPIRRQPHAHQDRVASLDQLEPSSGAGSVAAGGRIHACDPEHCPNLARRLRTVGPGGAGVGGHTAGSAIRSPTPRRQHVQHLRQTRHVRVLSASDVVAAFAFGRAVAPRPTCDSAPRSRAVQPNQAGGSCALPHVSMRCDDGPGGSAAACRSRGRALGRRPQEW